MNRSFLFLVVFLVVLLVGECLSYADYPSAIQERATILQESGGNVNAIGDKYDKNGKLKPSSQWSYGDHQIGWKCVADINKKFGTNYKAEDCLGNPVLSSWIYREYCNMYATEKKLGHTPTNDDFAGIWNGGPNGWKSSATAQYRKEVAERRKKLGK